MRSFVMEQANAHLKAVMRIFPVSDEDRLTSRDDFLLIQSRVEELEKVAEAVRAANDPPDPEIQQAEQRVTLLASLRDLVARCDESAEVLRGRFGAFMEDVHDQLESA